MPYATFRTLRASDAIAVRRRELGLPHMAPLRDFVQNLREEGRGVVPDFDPFDGGTDAQALFLMEKPGPMTDSTVATTRSGSGFISRDNDDPTAEATLKFMQDACIDRKTSIIWNTVPWWNGTRRITRRELDAGLERLSDLIDMLPELRIVVGVGAKAGKAETLVDRKGLPFLRSAHPSPINRASRRAVWEAIPSQWANVLPHLSKLGDD